MDAKEAMGEIRFRFRPVDLLVAVLLIILLGLVAWEVIWRALPLA